MEKGLQNYLVNNAPSGTIARLAARLAGLREMKNALQGVRDEMSIINRIKDGRSNKVNNGFISRLNYQIAVCENMLYDLLPPSVNLFGDEYLHKVNLSSNSDIPALAVVLAMSQEKIYIYSGDYDNRLRKVLRVLKFDEVYKNLLKFHELSELLKEINFQRTVRNLRVVSRSGFDNFELTEFAPRSYRAHLYLLAEKSPRFFAAEERKLFYRLALHIRGRDKSGEMKDIKYRENDTFILKTS